MCRMTRLAHMIHFIFAMGVGACYDATQFSFCADESLLGTKYNVSASLFIRALAVSVQTIKEPVQIFLVSNLNNPFPFFVFLLTIVNCGVYL